MFPNFLQAQSHQEPTSPISTYVGGISLALGAAVLIGYLGKRCFHWINHQHKAPCTVSHPVLDVSTDVAHLSLQTLTSQETPRAILQPALDVSTNAASPSVKALTPEEISFARKIDIVSTFILLNDLCNFEGVFCTPVSEEELIDSEKHLLSCPSISRELKSESDQLALCLEKVSEMALPLRLERLKPEFQKTQGLATELLKRLTLMTPLTREDLKTHAPHFATLLKQVVENESTTHVSQKVLDKAWPQQ